MRIFIFRVGVALLSLGVGLSAGGSTMTPCEASDGIGMSGRGANKWGILKDAHGKVPRIIHAEQKVGFPPSRYLSAFHISNAFSGLSQTALNLLKGQVMKLCNGKANPQLAGEILQKKFAP